MAILTNHKLSVNLETIKDMTDEAYENLCSYVRQWDDQKSREDLETLEAARTEPVDEPKAAKKSSKAESAE